MRILKYLMVILCLPLLSLSQISGVVSAYEDGQLKPLPGANVFWEGTQSGVVTDSEGKFSIEKVAESNILIASFLGYRSEKQIVISRKGTMNFYLVQEGSELSSVDVVGKVDATTVDLKRADLTFRIDDKELRKAACCNLSESFETNASVDVSFTDAVTGTRQIEMLGLSGKYALIQRENIPFARGLNATTGLTYIPGPFVQSLQLTKGLSSVLNGYESITGQINVEFYKPETSPLLLFNAFGNQGGRYEGNLVTSFDVGDHLATTVLAHGSTRQVVNDVNGDGFVDMPLADQVNVLNRWHYHTDKGLEGQIGFSYVNSNKVGGQTAYVNEESPDSLLWGYRSEGSRAELFGKTGYVFKDKAFRSFGFIYSLSTQDHFGTFGLQRHYGEQQAFYINTIFQDVIKTSAHKYSTGISVQGDYVTDQLTAENVDGFLYDHRREEIVPGAYIEYTYEPGNKLTLVAGVRADYNSYFDQAYVTPRLNLRYMPGKNTTLRIGGGRGQRTANAMFENLNVLASSRAINTTGIAMINPEVAWNSGLSISQDVKLGDRKLKLNADAFFTWFENKLIVDLDKDATQAIFLNASGSQSLSVMVQADYELLENLEWRLAYKYLDTRDAFLDGLRQSYLIPLHRAFTNLAYSTESGWKFDLTLNWFGEKRLPITANNPVEFQRPEYSDDFFTLNAQINRTFKNGLEFFVGSDNLLNFRQEDPIINADNPYDTYFDTNFAWGPIFGRNIYLGLYYTLEKKKK